MVIPWSARVLRYCYLIVEEVADFFADLFEDADVVCAVLDFYAAALFEFEAVLLDLFDLRQVSSIDILLCVYKNLIKNLIRFY